MLLSFDSVTGWSRMGPVALLALIYTGYLVLLGVYRVYISSLSKYPGPKLAGLTTLYQAYYDWYLGGKWFEKVKELHEEYGPIVRINPHEIHINDPEFSPILFASNTQKRDKYKWIGRSLLLPDSLVATIGHDLHRKRRAVLNPYFSKSSVRRLEGVILETTQKLLRRIQQAGEIGSIMSLDLVFRATTCDIITGYCFGLSSGYIDHEDYNKPYFDGFDALFNMSWPMTYISWLGPLMDMISASVMGKFNPNLKAIWDMHATWSKQIELIKNNPKPEEDTTIFHGIIHGDLPAEEKSTHRMRQEAHLVILAGQDTTAITLSGTVFELLANPDKLQKLRAELLSALPEPDSVPSLAIIEKLPYLSAVINECIRIHPGSLVRMTRVAPKNTMIYHDKTSGKEWEIPPNTPTQMTAFDVNMNPDLFPDPYKFEPERFIEDPQLEKHLLTFSRGTRMCIGFNLAYAELYVILAGIFRKYDVYNGTGKQTGPTLELYDTIRSRDVDPNRDFIVPTPAVGSKGVRVLVRE